MSYAGKDPRSRRAATRHSVAASVSGGRSAAGERAVERQLSIDARGLAQRATHRKAPDEGELDWQHIAIFAAGALIGAAVGAGASLLFAPQSGARTRHDLARRGRHLRARTADAWDDLRNELRYAASRGRRKLSRKVRQAMRNRRARRDSRDDSLSDD